MNQITIRDVKVFVTAPKKLNLVVVKVETSEPELYGLGCATFTWRHKAVITAIEEYLRPMVIGKSVHNIEEIWQLAMSSSYWRNGPVLNNAIAGIDEALWDIKGKIAGMPVYQLLGGKAREGIHVYPHVDGSCIEELEEEVIKLMEQGYRYVRVQLGQYGGNSKGKMQEIVSPAGSLPGAYYNPHEYMKRTVYMMERIRADLGWEIELLHDIHERLPLADALQLTKELEAFKLFFLEDALPPEQASYFEILRKQTAVPLAVGELFTHPLEWRTIVQNQWIDFIRAHISDIGGFTPARKLAAFCEMYQVRTAWHGPDDMTPIGMTAQMHLDLNVPNFGIQEFMGFTKEEIEIFPGCPEIQNGYAYLSERPGWGIDFNEEEAKKYPAVESDLSWLAARIPDGTIVRA